MIKNIPMFKPITMLPFAMSIMMVYSFFAPTKSDLVPTMKVSEIETVQPMPPALICKPGVTFFYDVRVAGVKIKASDLYTSVSGTNLSFFIKDTTLDVTTGVITGTARLQDSISYGIQSLSCTVPKLLTLTVVEELTGGLKDSSSCRVSVIMCDTLPPTIKCPPRLESACDTIGWRPYNTSSAFINAGGMIIDSTFEVNPMNFENRLSVNSVIFSRSGCFQNAIRKYTIRDFFNNSSSCFDTLMIRDTAIITCRDTTLYAGVNCNASYTPTINRVVDLCSNIGTSLFTHSGPINNTYPLGTTNVAVKVLSTCQDTGRCTFKVNVLDTLPPSIVCPPKDTVYTCGFPSPFSTLAQFRADGGRITDNCDSTNLTLSSANVTTLNNVCYKILTRRYSVIDANGKTASCTYEIVAKDTSKPSFGALPTIQLFTKTTSCSVDTVLPSPSVSDNCTPAAALSVSPSGRMSFNKGTTTITWTVTDSCGNSRTANQTVVVTDNVGPKFSCLPLRSVTLGSSLDSLSARFFVGNDSLDNCGGRLTFNVRRMTPACNKPNTFANQMYYCCNDVDSTINVIVEARDTSGNASTCMTSIIIQEKNKPVKAITLPDITVSCDYLLTLNNLSPFGTYVDSMHKRKIIAINDTLAKAQGELKDGLVSDVCLLSIIELSPIDNRIKNNTGDIFRRFKVEDIRGLSDTFIQKITVRDIDTLKASDITWPQSYEYDNCKIMPPSADVTGRPIVRVDDPCTITGVTMADQIFDNPISGCKYIRRKWRVIDWATFVPNSNRGVFEYIQEITLINKNKPVFDAGVCGPKTICADGSNCDAAVRLSAHGTDDCTEDKNLIYAYEFDLNNNGTIDASKQDSVYTNRLPRGVHSITWKISDRCGNVGFCNSIITVKECKAPTAICLNGLATNLENGGSASVWAKDFDNYSSDNCTPKNQLSISFSPDSVVMNRTFTCKDKGRVNLSIYFTDLDGNQSRCITFIDVQDNRNFCPTLNNDARVAIGGKIAFENNVTMKEVEVFLNADSNEKMLKTDVDGIFMFNELAPNTNYTIVPRYKGDWLEGVNTMDLVLMQRHILGLAKFDSPYKLIAADIDNNKKINASDLVNLRKLILGTIDNVEKSKSWRFVNKSFEIPDPKNPWNYTEESQLNLLSKNQMDVDFISIKTGDVSNTIAGSLLNKTEVRSAQKIAINTKSKISANNQQIEIPIYASQAFSSYGTQLAFDFDPSILTIKEVKSGVLNITEEDYSIAKNKLVVLHSNNDKVMIKNNDVLFTIVASTKDFAKINSAISLNSNSSMSVNEDMKIQGFDLQMVQTDKLLTVDQNKPNPFAEYTDIKFNLRNASDVKVAVYASSGSLIYELNTAYNEGDNNLRLGRDELGQAIGIFYVHITTGEENVVKKIMRLK